MDRPIVALQDLTLSLECPLPVNRGKNDIEILVLTGNFAGKYITSRCDWPVALPHEIQTSAYRLHSVSPTNGACSTFRISSEPARVDMATAPMLIQ